MAIDRIPGVGPQNTDIANAVAAVVPTNSSITNIVQTFAAGFDFRTMTAQQTFNTSSNNITVSGKNWVFALLAGGGGGGVTGLDETTANFYPSYGGGAGGGVAFGMVPVNTVAVIGAGGGGNGTSNVRGAGGGFSTYAGLRANGAAGFTMGANQSNTFVAYSAMFKNATNGWESGSGPSLPGLGTGYGYPGQYNTDSPFTSSNLDSAWQMPQVISSLAALHTNPYPSGYSTGNYGGSGATGGGGHFATSGAANNVSRGGGNSMNHSGGAQGTRNVPNAAFGGGGGAGISGAGGNGGNTNNTTGGAGGTGGTGGGGGGGGGNYISPTGTTAGAGGAGGAGALILYY